MANVLKENAIVIATSLFSRYSKICCVAVGIKMYVLSTLTFSLMCSTRRGKFQAKRAQSSLDSCGY